jgi:kinesin family protein C2/C3
MQPPENDLTKANSYNAALSSQLANAQPQLNSLEAKVSTLSSQLTSETQRRVLAEMKSEEAENRMRETEGTLASIRNSELRKLREENEDLFEKLAFVEGEAEDYRTELNAMRERHRGEVEELRGDIQALTMKLKMRDDEVESLRVDVSYMGTVGGDDGGDDDDDDIFDATPGGAKGPSCAASSTKDEREEYIKTLEDELELVTEQLIEAETRLSRTQTELEEAQSVESERRRSRDVPSENGDGTTMAAESETNDRLSERIHELESSIEIMEEENSSLREETKRLREELELVLEELALSKEELEAHDEDRRERSAEINSERMKHKEEVAELRVQLEKSLSEERCWDIQSKTMEEALVESKQETQAKREEVDRLEAALRNSKKDCETLQDEMEELRLAFDESSNRVSAEAHGEKHALEELLATRSRESDSLLRLVCELKEEVTRLTNANSTTAKMLKDSEDDAMNHQTELERQRTQQLKDARDAINNLDGLLEAARKELNEQKNEFAIVRISLQDIITHTQSELINTQDELTVTRSKLVEMEKNRFGVDAGSKLVTSSSALQAECNRLEEQNRMSTCMIGHLENEIMQLRKESMNSNASKISPDPIENDDKENDPVSDLTFVDDNNIEGFLQSNDPDKIASEVRAMAKKMSAQKSHNAELLTRILKLQGNIQVCCRIRPMTPGEAQQGLHEVAQSLSETEVGCFDERTRSWKSFAFDKVWGPESRQKDVFQDVEPLALSVIDGYNACIFAYGQSKCSRTLFFIPCFWFMKTSSSDRVTSSPNSWKWENIYNGR